MRSVRLRLLAGAACAIAAALAISWLALVLLFEAHLRRTVEEDLIRHGQQIVSSLTVNSTAAAVDPSVAGDVRFDRPASGLYWQVSQEDALLRSRSLWDAALEQPQYAAQEGWGRERVSGPFGQEVIRIHRQVRLSGTAAPFTVIVALDQTGIDQAREDFSVELAACLLFLWAALSIAAWLQVRIGLGPLRDVETSVRGLASASAARLDPLRFPTEVEPLVNQINALAQARETELSKARDRAANLAHALKTPLAALAALARKVRAGGEADLASGLETSIRAATETVERELARARTAASRGRGSCEAEPVLERLASVLQRTERGSGLSIDIRASGARLPVHADQLLEMAGPLMENAVRHAGLRVVVTAEHGELRVEDDGPGLEGPDRDLALLRGRRADERPGGHGLGLSIAADLAEATGGHLELGTSSLGGLLALIRW